MTQEITPSEPTLSEPSSPTIEELNRLEVLQRQLNDWQKALDQDRPMFLQLAEELKDPITEQRWNSVIGDDVSGHWTAVFVHHLIKRYAQENGGETPRLVFVAPDSYSPLASFSEKLKRRKREKAIGKFLKKRQERLGLRTLLVTEFIAGGRHIKSIADRLPEQTKFDVASLAIDGTRVPRKVYGDGKNRPNVYVGGKNILVPEVFYRTGYAAARQKDEPLPIAGRRKFYDPRLTQGARNLTIELADEIYDEVFRLPNQKEQQNATAA